MKSNKNSGDNSTSNGNDAIIPTSSDNKPEYICVLREKNMDETIELEVHFKGSTRANAQRPSSSLDRQWKTSTFTTSTTSTTNLLKKCDTRNRHSINIEIEEPTMSRMKMFRNISEKIVLYLIMLGVLLLGVYIRNCSDNFADHSDMNFKIAKFGLETKSFSEFCIIRLRIHFNNITNITKP